MERFFTPRSLSRVCEAVEWEETVVEYNDGTTNQSRFMTAMGILWERWMRGWSIPDFGEAVRGAGAGEYVSGLRRILDGLEARISMLVGFYQGLWWSANPDWGLRARVWPYIPGEPATPEELAKRYIEGFCDRMGPVLTTLRGETYGERVGP